jgi:hypothetical protein
MTTSRIQELESLGFEWDCYDASCLPTIVKSTDTAMFLRTTAKTSIWLNGSRNKGNNTSCNKRKEIHRLCPLSNPGIGKLSFRMGWPRRCLERVFERACRLSQNSRALQCSYKLPRKYQAGWLGRNPKSVITGCTEKERNAYDALPYPGNGKPGF